jgi:integrase
LAKALGAAREAEWPVLPDLVLFLTLTGWRASEACKLKWEQVNLDGRLAVIESKTGTSRRPLAKHAVALLEARRASPTGYVFPAVDGGPVERLCSGGHGIWARLMGPLWNERDPLTGERVTAHTLRHSFVSLGVELGFNLSTVGAIVGHSSPDVGGVRENRVTGGYAHVGDAVLLNAVDEIASRIAVVMAGGNVIPLEGRRRRAELRESA